MAVYSVQRYRREWTCTFLGRYDRYGGTIESTTIPAANSEVNVTAFTKPAIAQDDVGEGMGTYTTPRIPGRVNMMDSSISFGEYYADFQKHGAYYRFEINEKLFANDGTTESEVEYEVGGYLRENPTEEFAQDNTRRDMVLPLRLEVYTQESGSKKMYDIDAPAHKFESFGSSFF